MVPARRLRRTPRSSDDSLSMSESDPETRSMDAREIVAQCVEDYRRRRAAGARPMAEDYEARAGASYADFLAALAADRATGGGAAADDAKFPREFGEYTLLSELGRGAVGIVYEAMHKRLGRRVALKLLKGAFDEDDAAIERFRREAMALAKVKHDHVVVVYEAGETDGRSFYAMELLDGVPLSKLSQDRALPPMTEVFGQMSGVADALQTLHDAGIVHRDVKPSNIVVKNDGRMVLADFGLARTATSEALTRTGEALGTPYYMSPEQLLGKKGGVDGRADVYALGATLYELVAGTPPLKGDDIASTVRKILTERPAPLSDHVHDVPLDAERVVMKAIEKRPEDRYASAAAMRDDLRAFATGGAVVGRPVSAATRAARGARRFAWPIAAVVVAAGAFVAWFATRPPEPARLEVTSHPAAEVFVDGVSIGSSPVAREVPPGPHKITLKLAGFDDETSDVVLEPGHVLTKELDLAATDANDPKAVEKLAADLGVSLKRDATPPPAPAAPDAARAPFVALFPRGRVRIEDVGTLLVETGPKFEPGGSIEFWKGKERIAAIAFAHPPVATSIELPVPDDVKRALAVDDRVRWGYAPPHAPATFA